MSYIIQNMSTKNLLHTCSALFVDVTFATRHVKLPSRRVLPCWVLLRRANQITLTLHS